MIIDIVIILLLILLNGFFAMSEIAVVSAKSTLLEAERKKGSIGAERAIRLKSEPDSFLSSVQVGITLIGIINGAYGGAKLAGYFSPLLAKIEYVAPYADSISLAVVIITITYLSIVIGELVPKTIAISNSLRIAILVSRPIHWVSIIFYPFVRFLSFSTNLFNRVIGLKPADDVVSEMELRAMLRTASLEGVIEREENIIHEQVFYFSDKRARHMMTHRTDVEWIDISKDKSVLIKEILESKHSRILACNGTIDDFVGVIVMKELLLELYEKGNVEINELIRTPLIVPSSLRAQKLLERFRQNHNFLAVVVDEYGSLDGIVTLHDIIENLVGTMPDEDEQEEPDVYIRNENSALISGDAPIEVLTNFIDDFVIDFEEIDYSTVAGFVLEHINKMPQIGDTFDYENIQFEIVDIDGNKIDKIMVTKSHAFNK